jgi:hypothetical protein
VEVDAEQEEGEEDEAEESDDVAVLIPSVIEVNAAVKKAITYSATPGGVVAPPVVDVACSDPGVAGGRSIGLGFP